MSEPITVILVFGGQSPEHGVSCLTAAGVVSAIDTSRYRPVGIGITAEGEWVRYTAAQIAGLVTVGGQLPRVDPEQPAAVLTRGPGGVRLAGRSGCELVDEIAVDLAFPLLHGAFGEDGTIQGQFEMLGLPYVGSGVAASAVGMDKHLMKVLLASAGLPVLDYTVIRQGRWQSDQQACRAAVAALGLPVFVKPARAGSSFGITRVSDLDDLDAAVAEAHRFDPKVIVEAAAVGAREIECAVLGALDGGEPRTSRPGEIVVAADEVYDFARKYTPDESVQLITPAELPPGVEERVRAIARHTFTAIGAEGLSRVDTFLAADGQVVVNEINTMPGFTRFSMFPALWAVTGLDYTELISDLIEQARRRGTGLH